MSLGKVNYCLRRLIEKGWVKVNNFSKSENKRAYVYLLTPKGIEEKSKLTYHFLQRAMDDYDRLKTEIKNLNKEVDRNQIKITTND